MYIKVYLFLFYGGGVVCFFVLFWVFLHNLLIVIGQFLAPTTVHWRTKLNPNPYNAVAGQRLPSTGRK